ncbi:hypothetical protein HYQ15_gp48 [Lactococcus phage CHPC958]|uniref:Uncharacterized protein n=1 Tax=Lactococcus phage CHPC958 TaxID=2675254 RepID=A0A650EVZ2_9CAUD|nr:hypothetical protein HYQ15_gp48 [Lactococcus phage CHPC958]QGT53224.1 hypothetical protein CHPC958_000884 [Lactococcus phage CHPC958]
MVVKLTQEQADFLETFREPDEAVYYISRWGWCYALEDGNGEVYGDSEEKPFKLDEKLKMIEAVINGYEVIEPTFKFYNYSVNSRSPLYYAGDIRQLTNNEKNALKVKKDSEEYKALELLGFLCQTEV